MNKNININNNFNSYLAGLFEGNGHIWFPKINANKKDNPRLCITFNLKDELLARKLLSIIGYGFIRYKPKNNACVLTISPVKGLKIVIEYINGELKTPKIWQLHKLIDWINKNHSSNIEKLPLNNGDIYENGWLAGFIDADGHFSVRTTTVSKYPKMECKFEVSQRQNDHNNENNYEYLSLIADLLSTTVK